MSIKSMLSKKEETQDTTYQPRTEHSDFYHEIKRKIHGRLVEEANLAALDTLEPGEIRNEIENVVEYYLRDEKALLNEEERKILIDDIIDELTGLGPLEPFFKDPTVSDVLVNTYKDIYVERFGLIEKTKSRFIDETHLRNIIDRIISRVGRRIDESSPMVDARLPDGSRVNVIIPPLAIDGAMLSIRRFAVDTLKKDDLVKYQTLTPEIAQLLAGCVKAKLNIMISGGTGAGKTTLLNILSANIPGNERIITIEDSAELQLQQPHVIRLETRPPSIEGTGQVTQRDLVRNSLRMRPDRIVVGEVRGAEAFDMLQAMNTGHDGSLTTIHSNSPRDSLTRLESMILMTGVSLPEKAMRFMVSSALDLVIQSSRMTDGTRKITSVAEVVGMEGDVITLQEIFVFERKGIDKDGKIVGQHRSTGIRPKFSDRLEMAGIEVPENLFNS
ncbi:MAG: CpaF family protein [Desulfuromonadales bacterium]